MGYFDNITSSMFKTSQDGKKLFYPFGVFGQGYIIPDEISYNKIYKLIKINYMVMVPNSIIAGSGRNVYKVSLLVLYTIIYLWWINKECRKFETTSEKYTFRERTINFAGIFNSKILWMFNIVAIAFIIASVVVILKDISDLLIGIAGIIFFGFGLYVFSKMLLIKRQE